MQIAVKSNINYIFIELLYLDEPEPGSMGGSWSCKSNIFYFKTKAGSLQRATEYLSVTFLA